MSDDNSTEWDIDNNLPVYTRDFYKLYGIEGHICDCHRGGDQCLGCEALNCSFHERHKRRGELHKGVIMELTRLFPDGYELYTRGELYARKEQ